MGAATGGVVGTTAASDSDSVSVAETDAATESERFSINVLTAIGLHSLPTTTRLLTRILESALETKRTAVLSPVFSACTRVGRASSGEKWNHIPTRGA